ncbi:MAG: hypothetical protein QM628_07180 [Propionicimonas sp.]
MLEPRAASADAPASGPLLMRAGTIEITPTAAGPLAGYAARGDALSTGTQDPLEAGLLVLDDGRVRAAWLSIDAVAVPSALADRLRVAVRTGLGDPDVDLVVSASHTHSAPVGWVGSIHPGHSGVVDPATVAELTHRLTVLATDLAGRPAESVVASWSHHRAVGLGANRLDPAGPHDDRIGVLILRSAETGALRALALDAANHPTVFGPTNLRWSADWPGAARRVLRAAAAAVNETSGSTASAPIVVFLQGAAGDASARFTRRGADAAEVSRLGTIAAAAAIHAIAHDGFQLESRIRHLARTIELQRRPLPSVAAMERELADATAARGRLATLPPLDPRVRLAQSRLDGALVQRSLVIANPKPTIRFPISATAIGDLALMHVPVELFTSIADRICSDSPFAVTRIVGYADDYLGYMVDESAFEHATYEALSSLFLPSAAEDLVREAHRLLKEIR